MSTLMTPQAPTKKDNKYLTFFLNTVEYGMDILKVREIISVPEITPLPNSSSFLKGVINLRGTVIPIIDLRLRFNLSSIEITPQTCIIVVEKIMSSGKMILTGLLVDAVSRVSNINASNIGNYIADQINQDYIIGIAKDDAGSNKILLDIDRVLKDQEGCLSKVNQN